MLLFEEQKPKKDKIDWDIVGRNESNQKSSKFLIDRPEVRLYRAPLHSLLRERIKEPVKKIVTKQGLAKLSLLAWYAKPLEPNKRDSNERILLVWYQQEKPWIKERKYAALFSVYPRTHLLEEGPSVHWDWDSYFLLTR